MKQCPCPMPPGGQVTCEDHQVALCRVVGGVPHGECVTPPDEAMKSAKRTGDLEHLYRWALEHVTGRHYAHVTERDLDILRSGHYIDPKTNEEITFSLPGYFILRGGKGGVLTV